MGFPRSETDLMVWLNNFAENFSTHAPTLGFNAAEVAAVPLTVTLNYISERRDSNEL